MVTDDEQRILSNFGQRLGISPSEQQKCFAEAGESAFQDSLAESLEDGQISDEEAEMLHELRSTLGLPEMNRDEFGPRQRQQQENATEERWEYLQRETRETTLRNSKSVGILVAFVFILGGILLAGEVFLDATVADKIVLALALAGIACFAGYFGAYFEYRKKYSATYCRSCKTPWTVRNAGESEWRGWLVFQSRYDLYQCMRCGHETWRRYVDPNKRARRRNRN